MTTKITTGQSICPKCGNVADPENWRPPAGLDPHLVKFKCTAQTCGHSWYDRITNPERRAAIQARIKELTGEDQE